MTADDDDDDGGDVDLDDMDIVDQQRGPMGMFEASVVQGEGEYYAVFLVFHALYVQRDELWPFLAQPICGIRDK